MDLSTLRNIELFSGLADESVEALGRRIKRRTLANGQILFHRGEPGTSLYVVVEGMLTIRIPGRGYGTGVEIGRVQAGEVVGEMAALDPAANAATAVAIRPTTLLELSRESLELLRTEAPAAASALLAAALRNLARRLRAIDDQIIAEMESAGAPLPGIAPAPSFAPSSPPPGEPVVQRVTLETPRGGVRGLIDSLRNRARSTS